MPTYGGLSPFPERYGGSAQGALPLIKNLIASIGDQLGSAYDVSSESNVYAHIQAYARALSAAWSANRRLACQWDSRRITDFIPRWEKIFGIVPNADATDSERRRAIEAAFLATTTYPTYQILVDTLTALLGDVFVGLVHNDSDDANVWTPVGWPVGVHDPAGIMTWRSSIADVLIVVRQTTNQTDAEFYEAVAKINPVLEKIMPAWMNWHWGRYLHSGSTPGFYLADGTNLTTYLASELNVDNEVFDEYAPTDETGCTLYLDANDFVNSTCTWPNSGTAGGSFTRDAVSGAGYATRTDNSINGRSGIYFDGTAAMLSTLTLADVAANNEFTLFFTYKTVSVATDSGTATSNDAIFRSGTSFGVALRSSGTLIAYNNDGAVDTASATDLRLPSPVARLGYVQHTGGNLSICLDGVTTTVSSGNTSSLASILELGVNNGSPGTHFFNGYLGDVVGLNTTTNAAAMSRVTSFLRAKWGI